MGESMTFYFTYFALQSVQIHVVVLLQNTGKFPVINLFQVPLLEHSRGNETTVFAHWLAAEICTLIANLQSIVVVLTEEYMLMS